MKILKFGGTSVGSPERIRSVGELVTSDAERKIVVLSAMAKTTNSLIEISDSLYSGDREEANRLIDRSGGRPPASLSTRSSTISAHLRRMCSLLMRNALS